MVEKKKKKASSGFTLLEMLLSISILAVLLAIVLASLRLGMRSWEKAESTSEDAAAVRTISARLFAEIGSMYPYMHKTGEKKSYLFTGRPESIGFVTVLRSKAGLPWGGAKWVYYEVGKRGLTVKEKTVPFDGAPEDGGEVVELGGKAKKIRFEYLGENGWEKSWDADDKKGLPRSVTVRLGLDGSRQDMVLTIPVRLLDVGRNVDPALE